MCEGDSAQPHIRFLTIISEILINAGFRLDSPPTHSSKFSRMAGDAFFQKSNKRKRTGGAPLASTNSGNRFGPKKFSKTSDSSSKGSSKPTRRKDKESDDESDGGDIDDMDLREDAVDDKESGDEVENETAAAKRLRLAKIYLDSVRNELGESLSWHSFASRRSYWLAIG